METNELARASDPTTPPHELRSLASRGQPRRLRAAVAANPAAPLDLVLELCGDFPEEALGNPLLELATLENPALFSGLSSGHRAALAGSRRLSTPQALALLGLARSERGCLEPLARNPALPPEAIQDLAARFPDLWLALARNPALPPGLALTMMGSLDARVRAAAAAHPAVDERWRRRLAALGIAGDLAVIPADLGAASGEDFDALLASGPWFLQVAALLPGLTGAQCARLLATQGEHRVLVAMRRGLPAWLLDELERDASQAVRQAVRQAEKRSPLDLAADERVELVVRTPSLRAPVVVGQWLVDDGERVAAGTPVVELLCKANDAVLRLVARRGARVRQRVERGQLLPGQPVACLEPEGAAGCAVGEDAACWEAGDAGALRRRPTLPMDRGAALEVPFPRMMEASTEGLLSEWLVRPGDTVAEGQPLARVSLDKCDVELVAPYAGVVVETCPDERTLVEGEVYLRMVKFF